MKALVLDRGRTRFTDVFDSDYDQHLLPDSRMLSILVGMSTHISKASAIACSPRLAPCNCRLREGFGAAAARHPR